MNRHIKRLLIGFGIILYTASMIWVLTGKANPDTLVGQLEIAWWCLHGVVILSAMSYLFGSIITDLLGLDK